MTQIPLLNGIAATERADFNLVYPTNLEPVAVDSKISKGYLRSAMGAVSWLTGPGVYRGGINWNGVFYAVMGTSLVMVSSAGVLTSLGDVGPGGPCALDYGFDRLAIQSGTSLYYWNGTTLQQVTDPDLGQCLDMLWMAGYYVSFDDRNIIVTQLSDPTQVDPLKYGSAEADPDMITGGIRLRNELYVTGQYTIEVFNNVGGAGFPFQPSEGATIPVGCVGARAKCLYGQSFAFCGQSRNQGLGIFLAGAGSAQKLSTRAIDDMLAAETNPSAIVLEARVSRDEQRLYVHLTDKTLVYLANASQAVDEPVWYVARSGIAADQPYRPRMAVLCYNKWIVGDTSSNQLGLLDESVSSHFGGDVGWEFMPGLVYNGAKGFILHDLELVGLPGRGVTGPVAARLSFSGDGETWTNEVVNRLPASGNRTARVTWTPHKRCRNYVALRFRGDSNSLAGFAALEARIEGLTA